jgi:hypothetical protein
MHQIDSCGEHISGGADESLSTATAEMRRFRGTLEPGLLRSMRVYQLPGNMVHGTAELAKTGISQWWWCTSGCWESPSDLALYVPLGFLSQAYDHYSYRARHAAPRLMAFALSQ